MEGTITLRVTLSYLIIVMLQQRICCILTRRAFNVIDTNTQQTLKASGHVRLRLCATPACSLLFLIVPGRSLAGVLTTPFVPFFARSSARAQSTTGDTTTIGLRPGVSDYATRVERLLTHKSILTLSESHWRGRNP